jgi:hypothetical protein
MAVMTLALALAVLVVPAFAAAPDTADDPGCVTCLADQRDLETAIYDFSYGRHILYECSACHPGDPCATDGSGMPGMEQCFTCHGVYHGPQGRMASGDCRLCHGLKLGTLRPASHTDDWAETPHVLPSETSLTTECAMCHTLRECEVCHIQTGIAWRAPEPMVYDNGTGCLGCHGNPTLAKSTPEGLTSFEVTGLATSAHPDLSCIDCHVDFGYAPTAAPSPVWWVNAGLACASAGCHDEDGALAAWSESVHGVGWTAGGLPAAACGSCHGGHDIALLDTEAALQELHFSSEAMCAGCHEAEWANYNDPYHGGAYKRGAGDAPACWDCHPAHEMLAAADPESTTHPDRIGATCASCHQHMDAGETFAALSGEIIHRQAEVWDANPLRRLWVSIFGNGRE